MDNKPFSHVATVLLTRPPGLTHSNQSQTAMARCSNRLDLTSKMSEFEPERWIQFFFFFFFSIIWLIRSKKNSKFNNGCFFLGSASAWRPVQVLRRRKFPFIVLVMKKNLVEMGENTYFLNNAFFWTPGACILKLYWFVIKYLFQWATLFLKEFFQFPKSQTSVGKGLSKVSVLGHWCFWSNCSSVSPIFKPRQNSLNWGLIKKMLQRKPSIF